MPVASGAAGRVDVGVDTRTIWTADGLKKTKPPNRNHDSYLERYQELKRRKKNKTDLSQDKQDNIDTSNHENDGAEEASLQKTASRGDGASEKPPSGERSKKSQLCVIL